MRAVWKRIVGNNTPTEKYQELRRKGLTFEERVEILLWGSEELGVQGLLTRLTRVERLFWATVIMLILHEIGLVDNLFGFIGRLLQGT